MPYIGTKLVNATAATRGEYNEYRGWDIPANENPADPGYMVEYLDGGKPNMPDRKGYVSWSPAEQFEKAYREVDERASVTLADIDAVIVKEHYFTAEQGVSSAGVLRFYEPDPLALLTFCVLVLRNGFTVSGESACVSPANFDAEIGRKVARENAIEKVWPLMGYVLKEKQHQIATLQSAAGDKVPDQEPAPAAPAKAQVQEVQKSTLAASALVLGPNATPQQIVLEKLDSQINSIQSILADDDNGRRETEAALVSMKTRIAKNKIVLNDMQALRLYYSTLNDPNGSTKLAAQDK